MGMFAYQFRVDPGDEIPVEDACDSFNERKNLECYDGNFVNKINLKLFLKHS